MTVDTNIDDEIILLHDFEYELPCDVETCQMVADWKLTRRCCGSTLFYCDPDKVADERWLVAWGTICTITCGLCKTSLQIRTLSDAYTEIERL